MSEGRNIFNELYELNVNKFVEKKDTGKVKLSYLSWTFAWKEIKSRFPTASYEVVKFDGGLPYTYDPNTGYMVYTRVTIEGITHEMWLPVMDSHNCAMLAEPYEVKTKYSSFRVDRCTMFDVNKTIMRCLTKNLAMFGLGLYIYAGEDLPVTDNEATDNEATPQGNNNQPQQTQPQQSRQKQPTYPETDQAMQLKNALTEWINAGYITGDGQRKAEWYMYNNDIDGMNKTIAWCQSQTQQPA